MMAIYPNIIGQYRIEIESKINFNDLVDSFIERGIVDKKMYLDLWQDRTNNLGGLIDIILKDSNHCSELIKVLESIKRTEKIAQDINTDIDIIRNTIVIGGFPLFPLNYVVRNSVADTIKEEVLKLKFGASNTLVIYGLPGFGKSSLVNQVLQTKEVVRSSGNAMFWINLGEYQDISNIIYPLWRLYLDAHQLLGENPGILHCPTDVQSLKSHLTSVFLHKNLKNVLIVLDNVMCAKVLECFQFQTKLVVTTKDKAVVESGSANFIPIKTGFTEKESIQLLKKSLNTNTIFLKQALKIHELSSGCPMLLNMIASILKDSKDEALASSEIWDDIIEELSQDCLLNDSANVVLCMIKWCVDRLSPENQELFHSLAVFSQHVNIRREVLANLWSLSNSQVRSVMVKLEDKSLIVSLYKRNLKTYVYSIHSLVYRYLIQTQPTNLKDYHRKLISAYEDKITRPPPYDVNNNYIFGYYGHHIKNAELYDCFENYLNLQFVENKIKHVGSTDLFTDYDLYKDLITKKNPSIEKKLDGLKEFVSLYSEHLNISPEASIVQFGLLCDRIIDPEIYSELQDIVNSNPRQLYFKTQRYTENVSNFSKIKTDSTVTALAFLSSKKVLVGMQSGMIEIKIFDQYLHISERFDVHSCDITSLKVSPDKRRFLSISEDRTMHLWSFGEVLDPKSPKLKQSVDNWKDLHSPEDFCNKSILIEMDSVDKTNKDFIISADFSSDNKKIVTGSNKGKVMVWSITKKSAKIERKLAERGIRIPCISFSHDNELIIFSCDGKIYIYKSNFSFFAQLGSSSIWCDTFLRPTLDSVQLIALSKENVSFWNYHPDKKEESGPEFDSSIQCATVDDNLLVLAEDNGAIWSYDLVEKNMRKLIQTNYKAPLNMHILPEAIVSVYACEDSLQRFEVSLLPNETPVVHNVALFDCFWKNSQPIYAIVNENNHVQVFNNGSSIISTICHITDKITSMVFSLCGNYILLGTQDGNLFFYNYKKRETRLFEVCFTGISRIKCFDDCIIVVTDRDIFRINNMNEKFSLYKIQMEVFDFFYLESYLIIILNDSTWIVTDGIETIICDNVKGDLCTMLCCNFNYEKRLLGLCFTDGFSNFVQVFRVIFEGKPSFEAYSEILLRKKAKSLSFAKEVLAVGCDEGILEVFHLDDDDKSVKNQKVLDLHKKDIETVLFSTNSDPIFVSIGDQIAWWNLSTFAPPKLQPREKPLNSRIFNIRQLSLTNSICQKNKLHDSVPYLLSSWNIGGKKLKYISASKEFNAFLVIDHVGNISKIDFVDSSGYL